MSRSTTEPLRLAAALCLATVLGVAFMMILEMSRGRAWQSAAMTGLICGVGFAAVLGLLAARSRRRGSCPVEPGLSGNQQRVAARASVRGDVPSDPTVRRAAVRMARRHLDQHLRHQTAQIALLAGLLVVNIALAVTDAPSYWYGAGLWVVLLALRLWLPAHLRRRVRLLETADAGSVS